MGKVALAEKDHVIGTLRRQLAEAENLVRIAAEHLLRHGLSVDQLVFRGDTYGKMLFFPYITYGKISPADQGHL